ncbi:MAG: hypothetical protein R2851_26535 [Caldilineaceae bacterium]
MPFHMHVAEQRRELDECRVEYGQTPVALLADAGVLSPNFVGVHATHLTADEVMQLGQQRDCLPVSHHRAGPGRRPAPHRRVGCRGRASAWV